LGLKDGTGQAHDGQENDEASYSRMIHADLLLELKKLYLSLGLGAVKAREKEADL